MNIKRWLADNAVGLASLAVSACGIWSAAACGVGSLFEAEPLPMAVYTAAALAAGCAAGWAARAASDRSRSRISGLSAGEARAAYDLMTVGDPLPLGGNLDAVLMSVRDGRGVFTCSSDGVVDPFDLYSLTPSWRSFFRDHLDELGAAAGRPHRDPT